MAESCNDCANLRIVEDRNSEYHPFGICKKEHEIVTPDIVDFRPLIKPCPDHVQGEPEYP